MQRFWKIIKGSQTFKHQYVWSVKPHKVSWLSKHTLIYIYLYILLKMYFLRCSTHLKSDPIFQNHKAFRGGEVFRGQGSIDISNRELHSHSPKYPLWWISYND